MTDEPKRPIENQLEALAAQRRAEAGGPFTMPPFTRKLLLDEAMRVHPLPAEGELKTEANPIATRLVRMWRWLAVGATAVFVLLIVGIVYLPSRSAKMQMAQADRDTMVNRGGSGTSGGSRPQEPAPIAASAVPASAVAVSPQLAIAENKSSPATPSERRETTPRADSSFAYEAQRKGAQLAGAVGGAAPTGGALMDRASISPATATPAAKDGAAPPPGRAMVIRDPKPASASEAAALEAERAILYKAMAKSEIAPAKELAAAPAPATTPAPTIAKAAKRSVATSDSRPVAAEVAKTPAAPAPPTTQPTSVSSVALAMNSGATTLKAKVAAVPESGLPGKGGAESLKLAAATPAAAAEKPADFQKPAGSAPKPATAAIIATPIPIEPTVRNTRDAVDQPMAPDALQIRQQFTQATNRAQLRRNFNSPPTPTVLTTFTVENQGRALRIVDADGSVYSGLLGEVPVDRYSAPRGATKGGFSFRAMGTSRTFNDEVVFDGTLTVPADDAAAAQIRGRVTLGDRVQTDVNATVKK